jgi:succinyl-diaminopimelate desuccinylase
MSSQADTILREVDNARDEIVDFAADLIRIPTVNPPGDAYHEASHFIGDRLHELGFEVDYLVASEHPDHSKAYPRVNVLARRTGESERPLVHLNGHIDVVPPGAGWSVDPFAATVKDGKLFGRGSCDMKAGIAAAVYAAEAVRRAGVPLIGSVELSGTVDEESGGFAGAALLCEQGRISQARTDYVIIPEPLNVDRICVGHRGVYWFKITAHGRIAHGSMPFLGDSAIDRMGELLEAIRHELIPALAKRITAIPVVPPGARHATLNINAIVGGQAGQMPQSPCVADHCEAIFDRRFLREEGFETTKQEVEALMKRVAQNGGRYDLQDLMIVHPVEAPEDSPVIASLASSIETVLGRRPERIASPGTYDQKHVARIAGVEHCVAYGPGILELAHQVDEYCDIDDLVNATKVIALTIVDLVGRKR